MEDAKMMAPETTKEEIQDQVFPGTRRKVCPSCLDIGVIAFRTEEGIVHRVCQQEHCVGAERVEQESKDIVALLDSVDTYRTCLLAVGSNQEIVNRHRSRMFAEVDRFKESLR